jgi:hypothetical protein
MCEGADRASVTTSTTISIHCSTSKFATSDFLLHGGCRPAVGHGFAARTACTAAVIHLLDQGRAKRASQELRGSAYTRHIVRCVAAPPLRRTHQARAGPATIRPSDFPTRKQHRDAPRTRRRDRRWCGDRRRVVAGFSFRRRNSSRARDDTPRSARARRLCDGRRHGFAVANCVERRDRVARASSARIVTAAPGCLADVRRGIRRPVVCRARNCAARIRIRCSPSA